MYDGVSSTWARVLTHTAIPSLFPGVLPYPQSPRETVARIFTRVVSRVIFHTNGYSASHFSRVAFQCPSPANSISPGTSPNYEGDGIQENDKCLSALRPHRVQHRVRVRSLVYGRIGRPRLISIPLAIRSPRYQLFWPVPSSYLDGEVFSNHSLTPHYSEISGCTSLNHTRYFNPL